MLLLQGLPHLPLTVTIPKLQAPLKGFTIVPQRPLVTPARSCNSFGLPWGQRAPRLGRPAAGRSSCRIPGMRRPSACCVLPAGLQMLGEHRPRHAW